MKISLQIVLIFVAFLVSGLCLADPTSGPVKIIDLRPYADSNNSAGGTVYITVDSSTFCGTSVFRIDLSWGGAKLEYAAALSALVSGKSVEIEVPTTVYCTGWGQTIQSIHILNQ